MTAQTATPLPDTRNRLSDDGELVTLPGVAAPARRVRVPLDDRAYDILVGDGLLPVTGRLIRETMRPAATTEAWRGLSTATGAPTPAAFDGITRIDAASPREEAGIIALLMREVLEQPGKTAALVTPDRRLARRVSVELRRWRIEQEDGDRLEAPLPGVLSVERPRLPRGVDIGAGRHYVRAAAEAVRGPVCTAGAATLACAVWPMPG